MNRFSLIVSLFVILIGSTIIMGIPVQAEASLQGDWEGAIVVSGQELGIIIHFKGEQDNLRATIDIPMQMLKNYSLKNIELKGAEIYMELPSQVVGEFQGEILDNRIEGDYVQGPAAGEFYLQKVIDKEDDADNGDEEDLPAEDLSLEVDGGTLYGTLQLPAGEHMLESRKHPAALIIAGSGPTDRDGNSPAVGENNSLKMLAEGLAKAGIASLRYDKRMIAESSGINSSEEELRFGDYINDAIGWAKMLQDDARFSDLYIIGHSQGSLIGMVVVRETNADGFISIAGPGQSIDLTLKEQLATLEGELKEEAFAVLDSLKEGKTVQGVSLELQSLFRDPVQPFLISYIEYDPLKEIKKLAVPVLIIQGTTDLQVTTADARKLKEAYEDAELQIIEGMNHVLKEAPADPNQNILTYSNPDLPLADGLLEGLIEFIIE